MKSWPTVLGQGHAYVVNLPANFDLVGVLRRAKTIRLATAFGHRGGWRHFAMGVSEGDASCFLLTGLDCFQTEPALLRDWLDLKVREPDRIDTKLASDTTFFHPKVLIVTGSVGQSDFAIVGSGNLSQGGLHANTECSIYTEDRDVVAALRVWFDEQFGSAVPLTDAIIKEYTSDYKKNHQPSKKLEQEHRRAAKKLTSIGQAVMASWDDAVKEAKKFFQGKDFRNAYEKRRESAVLILKALKYPNFTFDRDAWTQFYSIKELGRLDPRYRDRVFRKADRLRAALRSVVKGGRAALPMVLDRAEAGHISGLGLNTISKILAAHDPKAWPVFNARVAKALKDFGYGAPHGASIAEKYLAYTDAMTKFRSEFSENVDAFALDAFFYYWSKRLDRSQR